MTRQFLALVAGGLLTSSDSALAPLGQHVPTGGAMDTAAERMTLHAVYPSDGLRMRQTEKMKMSKRISSADLDGLKLDGAMIWANDWRDMTMFEVPYGLYDVSVSKDGVETVPKLTDPAYSWMGGAYRGDRFYAVRAANLMGALTGIFNAEFDLTLPAQLRDVGLDEVAYGDLPSCMGYDMVSGDIYGIFYNDELTAYNWVKFDPYTLAKEVVCQFNGRFNPVALASAPDGKFYVVNTEGDLYSVNKSNSRVSLVGNTGVAVAGYTQAMAWNPATNSFVWAAVTNDGAALYSLDPNTAKATYLIDLPGQNQFCSLRVAESKSMVGVPAMAEDVAWNFTTPGSTSGYVSFTVADKADMTVYIDGEVAGEQTGVSGSVKVPFEDLAQKVHHVAVVLSNENGWAPVAESFQYVGFDYPLPVTDLTFEQTDGNATVTWTAPAGGVEKGYIDYDNLYYKVYRLPDEVEVADHLQTSKFEEALPSGVKRYAYRVVAYNGADRASDATVSNALIYGQSYEVPYTDDFMMDGAMDVYAQIDGDGDGQCWSLNNYSAPYYLTSSVTYNENVDVTDNWILTPNISFKPGVVYRVTLHMRNTWSGDPDHMAIGLCQGEAERGNIKIVKEFDVDTPAMTLLDHTIDFTVEEEGIYHVALGMLTPRGQGGGVFIDLLNIDRLGMTTAPEAVENLAVTPDADRRAIAKLTFKTPSKAIDGSELASPLNAVIYRDDEKIVDVADCQPGADCEWTDENVPVGTHVYKVRMANDSGEGADASASAFVGIYTVPFEDNLLTREAVDYYTLVPVGFEDNPGSNDATMHFPFYGDPCLEVDHMNFTEEHHEMYVVLPMISVEDENVLKLSYEYKNTLWGDGMEIEVVSGDGLTPSDFTHSYGNLPVESVYDWTSAERLMVFTNEGGHKYIALHITAPTNGYFYYYLRNLKVEYVGSSKAPDTVTDFAAASELVSKVTFKAPAVDYAGRKIDSLEKIEVYRNNAVVPSHIFDKPEPGQELEWIDADALKGHNTYLVVAYNENGRGNHASKTCFIGYDEPIAPVGLSIVPSADNQTANVSWERPERGVNGGVLDQDNMRFILVRYYPEAVDDADRIKILRDDITDTSVVPAREATEAQELVYYGVATMTPSGVSEVALYFTILGQPYAFPFTENFAKGEAASSMWLNTGAQNYGLQAMPTSDEVLAYNGFTGESQDGDGGMYMMLNGAMFENPIPFAVLTPKVSLKGANEPVLRFWLYKGNQRGGYTVTPSLNVSASTDETNFVELGDESWEDYTAPEWVACEYPLDGFLQDDGALIVQLIANAGGMADIMLLDNFRIEEKSAGSQGVDGVAEAGCAAYGIQGAVLTRGSVGSDVSLFTADGKLADRWTGNDQPRPAAPGMYMVSFAGKTFKVIVK